MPKKDNGDTTDLARIPAGNIATVRDLLGKMKAQMAAALPAHLTPERMIRIAVTAMQRNPQLLKCTQQSLAASVLTASQLGLETDGELGSGYLVPFRNTKTKQMEATFIPGYKGLIALAYNSNRVESIQAHIVYEDDTFRFTLGAEPSLIHEPVWNKAHGPMIGVYATAKIKGGGSVFEVLSKADVDAHRDKFSKGGFGWRDHYEAMAKKTAVRMLFKWLPSSIEMRTAVTLESDHEAGISPYNDETVVDVSAGPVPEDEEALAEQLNSKDEAAEKARYRKEIEALDVTKEAFDELIGKVAVPKEGQLLDINDLGAGQLQAFKKLLDKVAKKPAPGELV